MPLAPLLVPYIWPVQKNGKVVSGAKLFVYANNTTTLVPIWQNDAGTVAATNPQTSNADGVFREQSSMLFADDATDFTLRIEYPVSAGGGVAVYNNVRFGQGSGPLAARALLVQSGMPTDVPEAPDGAWALVINNGEWDFVPTLTQLGAAKAYTSRAAAVADLANVTTGALVDVLLDETRGNNYTRYQKTGPGTLTYVTNIVSAPNGRLSLPGIGTTGVERDRPVFVVTPDAGAVGGDIGGFGRFYIDSYGAFYSQAWGVISGVYDKFEGRLRVYQPGAVLGVTNLPLWNRENGYPGGMLGISQDVIGPNLALQNNNLTSGHFHARNARVVNPGTGYAVGDVVTASGGTSLAETATAVLGVAAGGTGHAVGNIIDVGGDDPIVRTRIRVDAVGAGGVITTCSIHTAGSWRRYPKNIGDTSQFSTTGTGTGARFAMLWPINGPARWTVRRVGAGGRILELEALQAGKYSAAPASTFSLTGGTGTGATLTCDWSTLGYSSNYDLAVDGDGGPRYSTERDGVQYWTQQISYTDTRTAVSTRAMGVTGCITLGAFGQDTLRTEGRFRADTGLWTPANQVSAIGHARSISMARTVPAGAQDTVALGTIQMGTAGGTMRVTAVEGREAVHAWDLPLIWQVDQVDGGADVGTGWAQVPAVMAVVQSGRSLALDAQVDASSGNITLRLRAPAGGTAANVDVQLDMVTSTASEVSGGDPGAPLWRLDQSTATATGVTPPTRMLPGAGRAQMRRVEMQSAAPASGATVTFGVGITHLSLRPTATIAALTVDLPSAPYRGQEVTIATTQTITTLTVTATGAAVNNGGASATMTAGTRRTYVYDPASFAWVIG